MRARVSAWQPEIVFHCVGSTIIGTIFHIANLLKSYATNVMGIVHVLDGRCPLRCLPCAAWSS